MICSTKMPKRIAATRFITKALALTLVLASWGISKSAQAASATWNTDANGSWNVDGNWNPASAPGSTSSTTNTDTATFSGSVITATRTVTVDANRNIFGIDFTASSNRSYTLSGGSILLTTGGFIQTSGTGSGVDNVNSSVTIQGDSGTASFTANSSNNGRDLRFGGTVTGVSTAGNTTSLTLNGTGTGSATGNRISGQITDGANGGSLSITKSGTGTWILTNSTNSYTGGTAVNGGALQLGTDNTLSTSTSPGSTRTVTLGGGTLDLNGTTQGNTTTGARLGALTLSSTSTISLLSGDTTQAILFDDYTRTAGT